MNNITQQWREQAVTSPALPKDLDARVYSELMKLARAQLARAGTMSRDAPSLVHETYLRLQRQSAIDPAQRNILFAYSAEVMRTVIIRWLSCIISAA